MAHLYIPIQGKQMHKHFKTKVAVSNLFCYYSYITLTS